MTFQVPILGFRVFRLPSFRPSLDKLISCVAHSYCPNYFIPEHNMFRGKIDNTNNKKILEMLHMMRSTGLRCITPHVFKGYEFLSDIPTHVSHNETNTKLYFFVLQGDRILLRPKYPTWLQNVTTDGLFLAARVFSIYIRCV